MALFVLAVLIEFGWNGEAALWKAGDRARVLQEAALLAQGALDASLASLTVVGSLPAKTTVAGQADGLSVRVDSEQVAIGLWEVTASVFDQGAQQPLVALQTLQAVRT